MPLENTFAALTGEKAPTIIANSTGTVVGNFLQLYAITDSVIATISTNAKNSSLLVGTTLLAGTLLPMSFNSISLTSGLVLAMAR